MAKKKGKEKQVESAAPSAPVAAPPIPAPAHIAEPKSTVLSEVAEEDEPPLPVRLQSPTGDQQYPNGGYDSGWPAQNDTWERGQSPRQSNTYPGSPHQQHTQQQQYEDGYDSRSEHDDYNNNDEYSNFDSRRHTQTGPSPQQGNHHASLQPSSVNLTAAVAAAADSRNSVKVKPSGTKQTAASAGWPAETWGHEEPLAPPAAPPVQAQPPMATAGGRNWPIDTSAYAPKTSAGATWARSHPAQSIHSSTMHHHRQSQSNSQAAPQQLQQQPAWTMWGKELNSIPGPKITKVNPLYAAPSRTVFPPQPHREPSMLNYSHKPERQHHQQPYPQQQQPYPPSSKHPHRAQQQPHPQQSRQQPRYEDEYDDEEEYHSGEDMSEYDSLAEREYEESRRVHFTPQQQAAAAAAAAKRGGGGGGGGGGKKQDHWGSKPPPQDTWGGGAKAQGDTWGNPGGGDGGGGDTWGKQGGDAWGNEGDSQWGGVGKGAKHKNSATWGGSKAPPQGGDMWGNEPMGDTWGKPSKGDNWGGKPSAKGDTWGGGKPAGDVWGGKPNNDTWGGPKPQGDAWGNEKPHKKSHHGGDGWDTGSRRHSHQASSSKPKHGHHQEDAWGRDEDDDYDDGGWGNQADGGGWGNEDDDGHETDWGHARKEDQWPSRKDDGQWSRRDSDPRAKKPIRDAGPTYTMPSRTLAYALSETPTKLTNGPVPSNGMEVYADVRFVESKGKALEPVRDAFFGKERLARDRIHWMFSPDKDERVSTLLAWIQAESYPLAAFGLDKFLQTRERGALLVNADYRDPQRPGQPAFDWLNFKHFQPTQDRILQESVAFYDPSVQVVVFIFLPSKSGKSVAVWRRKLPLGNNVRLAYNSQIAIATGALRKPKDYVVHVDAGDHGNAFRRKKVVSAPPVAKKNSLVKKKTIVDPTKPPKKRKWWQIW